MYDFEMLSAILKKIGYRSISKEKYREGEIPDLELLDNRPEDSLYIEATK